MSIRDPENFTGRVNYAAAWIVSGRPTSRSFDSLFENNDGEVVVAALCRRAEKNERLRNNLAKYIAESSIRDVPGRYHGQHLPDAARQKRIAARESWEAAFAAKFGGSVS